MTWFETKEQRRKNRGEPRSDQRAAYLAGRRRRQGIAVLTDKKSGETSVIAQNGCFGRLAQADRDKYDDWAQGTRGSY